MEKNKEGLDRGEIETTCVSGVLLFEHKKSFQRMANAAEFKRLAINNLLRQVALPAYQPVYSPLQRHGLPFTEGERLCLN